MKDYTCQDFYDSYNEMLDECCPIVQIGTLRYLPSQTLEAVDPIAYFCGFDDYMNSLFVDGLITQEQLDNRGVRA